MHYFECRYKYESFSRDHHSIEDEKRRFDTLDEASEFRDKFIQAVKVVDELQNMHVPSEVFRSDEYVRWLNFEVYSVDYEFGGVFLGIFKITEEKVD